MSSILSNNPRMRKRQLALFAKQGVTKKDWEDQQKRIEQHAILSQPVRTGNSIKLDPARALISKFFAGDVTSVGDRQIRVVCSDELPDRSGEIVVQSGIDLRNYRRNPIVLFQHNANIPVGRAPEVAVSNGQLRALIDFAPAGASPKADEVAALAKSGVISGISIGFDPIDWEPMDPAYPRGPRRYLAVELLEISIVSVPAVAGALVVERSFRGGSQAVRRAAPSRMPCFGDYSSTTAYQHALQKFLADQTLQASCLAHEEPEELQRLKRLERHEQLRRGG